MKRVEAISFPVDLAPYPDEIHLPFPQTIIGKLFYLNPLKNQQVL
jgi:hypothetical protein